MMAALLGLRAEALARLDPVRPPCDIPPKRWLCFIDDCGQFLDNGWADRATVIGWRPFDLFGCDRYKPYARIDRGGLLWSLERPETTRSRSQRGSTSPPPAAAASLSERCPNELGRVLASGV